MGLSTTTTTTTNTNNNNNNDSIDLKALLLDPSLGDNDRDNEEDDDSEDWDALDAEEAEALKLIASAMQITAPLTPDDYESRAAHWKLQVPADQKDITTYLLQKLLPLAKVVYEQQELDKRQAQLATELRDKRAMVKEKQKQLDQEDAKRLGYEPYNPNSNYNHLWK